LDGAAIMARSQGELKRATALLEECITIRRELGDAADLAVSLKNLGNVASDREDYPGARHLYEESLEIRRRLGDERGIAETLNNLGVLARFEDDWPAAAPLYEEALEFFRKRGDKQGCARVLMNLGEVKMEQGEYEVARALLKESIVLCREVGSTWDLTDILEEVAYVAAGLGNAGDGLRLYGAAEALRDLLGAPIPPSEFPAYQRRSSAVRAGIDHSEGDRLWLSGRLMALDAAVDLALSI
jgi:tetratricopeptide (TPR) repeat protein